ncbi:uncharacterized protein LOC134853881 [Symsagittifera roscoffensis]|uniref:uncharacterized protein LOC134853881 n=1 Tax=Symsagittifera roscoffensis TaxID=84072 RepID=UPI00307C1CAC
MHKEALSACVLLLFLFFAPETSCGSPSVPPPCDNEVDSCVTDDDCVVGTGRDDLVCMATGTPDNPGPKNCLCKPGYYGNPQEPCKMESDAAPIFGMYSGCYAVDKTDRKITQAAGDYKPGVLNTYSCREACSNQNSAYAVLQEGDLCFCSDDITGLGSPVDGSKCNSECSDVDPGDKKCGGFTELDGKYITESYSSIFTTQKGISSAWFMELSKSLETNMVTRAVMDYEPPAGFCKSWMNYQFDFGTGAGRTHPHPLTWMEWVYPYPGTFIVTGIADSRYPAIDATSVTVVESIRKEGVVASCGPTGIFRFGLKANCSVTSILGTGVMAKIFWGEKDRKQFDFSRIENPYHCQAGSPVLQSVSCADYLDPDDHFYDSGTAKQLFDPLYEFSCEGILKGFQYYVKAAGTGESIKFKLFAPSCGSGSEHWCFDTMTCTDSSTPCLPPFSYRCGMGGAYCQMGGGCTDHTCSPTHRSDSFTTNGIDYAFVQEWTVPLDDSCALDSCGCYGLYYLDLGTYSAPDHVRVYPGYILVLESGNNKVYYNRDVNSTDTVYLFNAADTTLSMGSEASTDTGIKWAFQGFLAQPSAINLTNNLPTPDGAEPYQVEIWVTADKFADEADLNLTTVVDGVTKTVPVYYFTFEVFSYEGFSNVLAEGLYEYHPFAAVGSRYDLLINLDNPSAYQYAVSLDIDWGDGSSYGPVDFLAGTLESHTYSSAGEYEVCVHAINEISEDTTCWTVVAYNPVPDDKYDVLFSDHNIGCPCGVTDNAGNYLGDGVFTVTISQSDLGFFSANFPTNATAYFIVDKKENIVLDQHLDESPFMPAGTDGQLVFTYTYDSPGCIDVGLVISNAISLFATATKVCVYERMEVATISKLVQIHRGQVDLPDPAEIPVNVYACDYDSDNNCAFYLNKDHYTRITLYQNSTVVNQTFTWNWADESEVKEETFVNQKTSTHLFFFASFGVANYRSLEGATVTISTPMQMGADAMVVPIVGSDGNPFRIALPPSAPQVASPGFVWKEGATAEVIFRLTTIGWKTCCLTFCEGCTTTLGFVQSFYDTDDANDESADDVVRRGWLQNGYHRCSNQSDPENPWRNPEASSYLDMYPRQDSILGIDWDGWEGEAEDSQSKLPSHVIKENKVEIKPFFGTKHESYSIHYFCWNPIGSVSAVYEFARKEPITCSFPSISIDYRGADVFQPRLMYRKDRNFLTGNVILNCDETRSNDKWWTCQPFSERDGKPSGDPYVPAFSGNTTSELVIHPKGLYYGVHKCTLYVKMRLPYSTPKYQSSEFTYIKILPYDILGQMYSSISTVDLGYTQTLRLDPNKYSVDLDIDVGEFVDFKWYSRCGAESYPIIDDELNEAYPPPLPTGKNAGSAGGAEGLGPGRIAGNKGYLDVTPAAYDGMRSDMTCELMAVFRKTQDPFDRTATAIITVNIKEYVAPTVEIRTGNGTPAEPMITADKRAAQKINPIGTFRAMSECTLGTNCDQVSFEWFLGCVKPDLPSPIDYKDMMNYENVTLSDDPEVQSVEKLRVNNRLQNVGVPMGLLRYQVGNKSLDCVLSLHVCNDRTEEQIRSGENAFCGWSQMNLRLNEPPTGGNVTLNHTPEVGPGNCLENYMYWSFSFGDWTDPDDGCIKAYKIIQLSGPGIYRVPVEEELLSLSPFSEVVQTALYSGPENPYREKVKFGDKANDWATLFCVRISDCLGAFTFYCVRNRFEKVSLNDMVTCQSQKTTTAVPLVTEPMTTTTTTTTTTVPAAASVTPFSATETPLLLTNTSAVMVESPTIPTYPRVQELLTDNPYQLEEESLLVERELYDAVEKNYTKYIAEGSQRNMSAFVQFATEQMNQIAAELEAELSAITAELELVGSGRETEWSEEENAQIEEVLAHKTQMRQELKQLSELINQEVLLGLEGGVGEMNSPEILDSVAGGLSGATKETDAMSEYALGSAKVMADRIGQNLMELAAEVDQETTEAIAAPALGATAGTVLGARDKIVGDGEEKEESNNGTEVVTTIGPLMPDEYVDSVTGTPTPLQGSMTDWGMEAMDAIDKISGACQMNKAAEEPNTGLATESMGIELVKRQSKDVTGTDGKVVTVTALSMPQPPKVKLPAFDYLLDDNPYRPQDAISLQSLVTPRPFLFGTPGDYLVGNSALLRISLSTGTENHKIQVPEARKAIDLHIPKDNKQAKEAGLETKRGWMELGQENQFILRSIDIEGDVAISVYVKYVKQVVDEWLCVYGRYGQPPFHDPVKNTWQYDFFEMLPRDLSRAEGRRHEGEQYPDQNVYMIENHLVRDSGTYWFGIRPCRKNFDWDYFDTPVISNKVFAADFEFNIWTQGCLFMEESDPNNPDASHDYKSRGCVVGSLSNEYVTECMCMHLTSFAGSLAPMPPALDFSAMSFKFEDMYPVYILLFSLWAVYLLIMMWARRQDKKDIAKLGFTPLPDNDPQDYYTYEMAIQTGMVQGAGTKSKVYFYLVGDQGRSRIHVVEDPYRRIMKRDSKDLFLLTTPTSLGKLTSVRLWHDNSAVGSDQNWFCDYVAFRDVQTGEKTFFMAYRWWSLVNEDGLIDRTIERTEPENMKQFRYMFAAKAREKLNDGHLYYSIFARPVESHFTRCQRCSCAMCILLLEFCVSAMYYQSRQSVDESSTVWVGPIKFNLAEMGVSLMSTLMVLPPALLVVELFRRTKPFMSEQEEELDDLDAEEEFENAAKRRNREERKRQERLKKLQMAEHLGVIPGKRDELIAPQSGPLEEAEKKWNASGRSSEASEHRSLSSGKSSLKQGSSATESGGNRKEAKNVQINERAEHVVTDTLAPLIDPDEVVNEIEILDSSSSDSDLSFDDDDDQDDSKDLSCCERFRKSKFFCLVQCCFGWTEKKRKKQPFMLPASFVYIDWLLAITIMLACTALISMYAAMIAFQGGSALISKWVVTMIVSMFMSIFMIQPFKIFLLAVLFSLLCQKRAKKRNSDTEVLEMIDNENDTEQQQLPDYDKDQHLYAGDEVGDLIVGKLPDEEYLDEENELAKRKKLLPGQLTRSKKGFLRIVRTKEIGMFGVVQEITVYALFTWLLFSVCYIEKDATGYLLYEEVKDVLFTNSFDQVHDIDSYWDYLIDHYMPSMYATAWYNGDRPLGLYGYFGDRNNLIIGYSVIRQLRVRKDLCSPVKIGRHNISRECIPPFADEFEDQGRYGPGWIRFDANNPYHILREEYRYVNAEEIDGATFWGESAFYPGGGFLVHLDGNVEDSTKKLQNLKNEKFIDRYTRAVFHEFAVYNPTFNLFAVVTMVAEFRASSGVFAYYYCDPLRLIMYHGPTAPYQILVQVGLGIFLAVFLVRDGRRIYKQRKEFFKKTWNLLDALIDLLGILTIVVFLYRYTKTEEAMSRVSLVGGRQFVNLNYLVSVSFVFLMILGSICFVSTIRFLKILNFNKKISMFRDVIVTCRHDIASFSIMFVVLQAGFVTMAYLFFGNFLVRYRTVFQTQQSLFNMLLGKFSFQDLIEVDEALAGMFFMSYSNCMLIVTMNIFVVILDASVGDVNEGLAEKSNEYEIISFMLGRVKYWVKDTVGTAKQTVHDIS